MLISRFPEQTGYDPLDVPEFTYTGSSQIEIEEGKGWKIKFLTSGTFTLIKPKELEIDVFLVGGGGGGGMGRYRSAGGGGGGGYTKTSVKTNIQSQIANSITIGNGGKGGIPVNRGNPILPTMGGGTSAFNAYSAGGKTPSVSMSGAQGGSNGGNGTSYSGTSSSTGFAGASNGNPGQGFTTREFGNTLLQEYAGGGGGGGAMASGGRGGGIPDPSGMSGATPLGYGGSGGYGYGGGGGGGAGANGKVTENNGTVWYDHSESGNGAQGIVIIRNAR